MLKLFFFAFCVLTYNAVIAQQESSSVEAAINNLFEGMRNADTVLMKNSFSSNASLQTIEAGTNAVKNEPIAEFIQFVGQQKSGAADEQIKIETVKIDGALAMVWTPYKFYFNQQFSHCGIDCFVLIKTPAGWKIQYIIDTRRKDNCP